MGVGMDWDILLAVLQGFAALYLAYMGVQATVNPGEKFLFIAIGLVIVVVGSVQAYRNTQDRQSLQTQLAAIHEDTKRISDVLIKPQLNASPTQATSERKERSIVNLETQFVTGRLPPFTSKNSFIMNVRQTNVSSIPARITSVWASAYAFDYQIRADEEDILYASLRESARSKTTENNVLGPMQYAWFTMEPKPALNDENASRLAEGKLYFYIMTMVIYSDSSGSHETELCVFFYGVDPLVHQCYSHNGPQS